MGEVMVTGATGGIGRAIVSALIADGRQVIAIGRDDGRLRALGDVRAVTADLASPRRLAGAIEPPGRLDALVHCAGVSLAAIAPPRDAGVDGCLGSGSSPGRLRQRAVGSGRPAQNLSSAPVKIRARCYERSKSSEYSHLLLCHSGHERGI